MQVSRFRSIDVVKTATHLQLYKLYIYRCIETVP